MVAEQEEEPTTRGKNRTTAAQDREELDREQFMEVKPLYKHFSPEYTGGQVWARHKVWKHVNCRPEDERHLNFAY